MYALIDKKKRVDAKKVGKIFLCFSKENTVLVYMMLGRNQNDNYIIYHIADVKGQTRYQNGGTEYYVEADQLKSMLNYFVTKGMNEAIFPLDLKGYRVLSSSFFEMPVEQPMIAVNDLEKWYLKSQMVVKDLPMIKFDTTKDQDLVPIKKKDLHIGHLYLDYRRYVYIYLGLISDRYLFQMISLENIQNGTIELELADKMNHARNAWDIKYTSSLPKLYDVDKYPVNKLPSCLQKFTGWHNKNFKILYQPCVKVESSDNLLIESRYVKYPRQGATLKDIDIHALMVRRYSYLLERVNPNEKHDVTVTLTDYPEQKETITYYYRKRG